MTTRKAAQEEETPPVSAEAAPEPPKPPVSERVDPNTYPDPDSIVRTP